MKVPFSPPRIDQAIIDEVTQALLSGWITTGPRTKEFERMLNNYTGSGKTHCVNSATAGLELILRWFGAGPGDEVIVPAYTYAATANVVIHTGARPVMVDSGPDFNMDVRKMAEAITAKTKVIIPVDVAGLPCDYQQINQIVQEKEIKSLFNPQTREQQMLGRILVLADAAHSIGAVYQGKKSGSLTDISVFSFHAVKNLTTAEGGAICLNLPSPFDNESVYKTLAVKSLHGQNKDALAKMQLGNWRYDIVEAGYKCNMTDIQAAMGIAELKRYEEDMLPRRKHLFQRYIDKLSAYDWAEMPVVRTTEKESSYHVFLLRINNIDEKQRDDLISRIYAQEVAVNVHFVPLPLFSFYQGLGYDIKDFPVAYKLYSREISLPIYYDLTDEMQDLVVAAVVEAMAGDRH